MYDGQSVVGILTPKLRAVRERKSISQQELAELAGLPQPTVSRLETQSRGAQPSTIRRLAEALDVEPREITGR